MYGKPTQQIILRRKLTFRRTRTAGPLNAAPLGVDNLPALGEPILEHAQLTPREVVDVQRDPEVQVIATPMPLKLIEPVGTPEPTAAATGNTWGIEAVRAHTSPFSGAGSSLQYSIPESTRTISPFKAFSWCAAISPKDRTMTRMAMVHTVPERFSVET